VASDNKTYTEEAIAISAHGVARETEAPLGYTQLAMAYGRKGDYAQPIWLRTGRLLRGDKQDRARSRFASKNPFAIGTPRMGQGRRIVTAKPLPGQKEQLE